MIIGISRKRFFALFAVLYVLALVTGCTGTSTQDAAAPAPESAEQATVPASPTAPSQANTEWLAPPPSTDTEALTASASVAPTVESIVLADSAEYVSSPTLNLAIKGKGNFTEMRISEDPDFKDSEWQTYSANPSFTLSKGQGKKEIYVQLKDAKGKTTSVVSSAIRHEVGKIETVAGFPEAGLGDVDDTDSDLKTHLGRVNNSLGAGVLFDGVDTLYWPDNWAIKKYTLSNGNLVTFVGDPRASGYKNGNGRDARFGHLSGGMTKLGEDLYIVDYTNYAIRKVDLETGDVTTLAGFTPVVDPKQKKAGFADGKATEARFNYIVGSCLTNDGTYLYLCDSYNHAIRQIDPTDDSVITIAGGAPPKAQGNKPDKREVSGETARFFYPYGIFFHAKSNSLIVSDSCNYVIRKIDLSKKDENGDLAYSVTHFSGSGDGTLDGDANTAQFINCQNRGGGIDLERDILVLGGGNVSGTLRAMDLSGPTAGTVKTIAGIIPATINSTAGMGFADTGANTETKIGNAMGPYASDGTYMYFTHNGALRKINLDTYAVETIQGTSPGFDITYLDDVGTKARFSNANAMAPDGKGNVYFLDSSNYVIRKMNLETRETTTVAGIKGKTGYQDGDSQTALFNYLLAYNIAFDKDNDVLYFPDPQNCAIRKLDILKGVVTTVAGSPPPGKPVCGFKDGPGPSAQFKYSYGVAFDKGPVDADGKPTGKGVLYVADAGNHRIRKIDLGDNTVTTLAGNGTVGYTDGKGAEAQLASPSSIQLMADGKLYVYTNRVIKSVDREGNVETIAGVPLKTGDDPKAFADGIGDQARLGVSRIVSSDPSAEFLYIFDYTNSALRKLDIKTKEVTTIAGGPDPTYPKDGFLSETRILTPQAGLMLDANHILISEGSRIRLLTFFKQEVTETKQPPTPSPK